MPLSSMPASAGETVAAGTGFRQARGTVVDRAMLAVDCSGPLWRLNYPGNNSCIIDWERLEAVRDDVKDATADYVVSLIRTHSPTYVQAAFGTLIRMLGTEAFPRVATEPGVVIGFEPFEEIRVVRRWGSTYLHHYRRWYRWCARRGHPAFDREIADRLAEVLVGNDPKGRAVLSDDPEEGPLTDMETAALAGALRAADMVGGISEEKSVALWLSLALGANSLNLTLLREEDYRQHVDEATGAVLHELRVPRIKKRHARYRTAFKVRKLNPEIGQKVAALIASNRARAARDGWPGPAYAKPIFVRKTPKPTVVATGNLEYAMHLDSVEFRLLVSGAVRELNVRSPRTGERLDAFPRRFRYTFITRFLREGGSLNAAAEAADHTDTRTVLTYTNKRGDLVARLDEAVALEMAPRAMAFLGMVVRSEAEAVRGEAGAASRVYHHARDRGAIEPVGTCGSFAFCGLTAPTACYECVRFQPWLDGPHEEVLRAYVGRRQDMMDRGVDEGQVRIMDRTILAVAAVVLRVSEEREWDRP
ncbi:MAG: hypothetical protein PGN25_04070 [Methylorubrum populi]